jgi:hypothetical protein
METAMDIDDNEELGMQKKNRAYVSLPKRKGVIAGGENAKKAWQDASNKDVGEEAPKRKKKPMDHKGKKKATVDEDVEMDVPESEEGVDMEDSRPVTTPPNQLQAALQSTFTAQASESSGRVTAEASSLIVSNHATESGLTSAEGSHFLAALLSLSKSNRTSVLALSREDLVSGLKQLVNKKA